MIVSRGVLEDPRCKRRLDAMLTHIDCPAIEVGDDATFERALAELGPRKKLARGGLQGHGAAKELVLFARAADREIFPGYSWREQRDGRHEAREYGVLCHSAVEIQSVVGCPFDCTYCPYSSFLCVHLDIENFVEQVARLANELDRQSLFKLNNRSDTLGLEPEYGLAATLVQRFAATDLAGKYLMLYSKGHAVDHLLDLDHRGKTIASFTLTPEPIAELLEPGAPPPSARIAAIGRLAAAGYPIRVRFSPIVPLRGWRAAYHHLIDRLCEVATPEMVTLWTLSMIELPDLDAIVPLGRLDPEVLAAAVDARAQLRGDKGAPFPVPTRAMIYAEIARALRARSPTTRVSLCLESPQVWDAAAESLVPRRGHDFVCNCGPRATPTLVRRQNLVQLRRNAG